MELNWDRYLDLTSLALSRADRFCDGATESTKSHAEDVLMECFGNIKTLNCNGLSSAFHKLARKVHHDSNESWQLLAGLREIRSNKIIHRYQTTTGKIIELTRATIVNKLLEEHINIHRLLRDFRHTSIYNIYKDVKF